VIAISRLSNLPSWFTIDGYYSFSACVGILDLFTFLTGSFPVRLTLLAGSLLFACPMVVATQLRPASSGLGTHQQLGLPPCSTRVLFGVRCPACGMTTSWAHLVRGDFVASMKTNPGGTMLGLIDISLIFGLAFLAGLPQWPARKWLVALAWALAMAIAVALADWAWRAWLGN